MNLYAELGGPNLSWRRFGRLARQLPSGSATHRSQDPEGASWDATHYLLALVFDALNAGNWQRGGGKGQQPKPLPRPQPLAKRRKWEEQVRRFKLEKYGEGGVTD